MDLNQDQSLFEALLNEDYKEASFLLSIGANPNRLFAEHGGISPFHLAVGLENHLKFTRLFLNNNANVNIRSEKENWTPLHVCACWNKYESLQLLLLNQANPFIKDKNGKSPLDIAIEHKSRECVKILREYLEKRKHEQQQQQQHEANVEHVNVNVNKQDRSNDYSDSIDVTLENGEADRSYSNIRTSTFDESNFEFYLNMAATKKRPEAQHQHAQVKPALKNKAELESLISNLIDMKLEQKQQQQLQQQSPKTLMTKSNSTCSSPKQSRLVDLTPTSKLTSSTQTKITGKRFYSPEKLPAFCTKPGSAGGGVGSANERLFARSNSATKRPENEFTVRPKPTTQSPMSKPPTSPATGILVTKQTQTTGRMVKLTPSGSGSSTASPKLAAPTTHVDQAKLKTQIQSTRHRDAAAESEQSPSTTQSTDNNINTSSSFNGKLKNWLSKISSPFNQTKSNEIKFKTSASFTRLHSNTNGSGGSSGGGCASSGPITNKLTQSTKIRSTSVNSLIKNEAKTKTTQELVLIKKDQSDTVKLKRRSSSLISSRRNNVSNSQLLYANSNVIDKLNTPVHNQFNDMLIRDQIGVDFFHHVLGDNQLVNRNLTPVRNLRRSDEYEYDDQPIRAINNGFITERPPSASRRNLVSQANTSLLTSDQDDDVDDSDKTIGPLKDDLNETKKTVSSYRTAASNNLDNYMDMLEVDMAALRLTSTDRLKYEQLGFSAELIDELVSKLDISTSSDVVERNMFTCFQNQQNQIEWREGNIKSAFNYILLDPRITDNLPVRAKSLTPRETFATFVSAIFYVGKGSRARPYAHLHDSTRFWKNGQFAKVQAYTDEKKPPKLSKKIERIMEIWDENRGVVSLHCFQSVIPSEAYTREAAMIDAIGMKHLTNMKKGNYYGESKLWSTKRKNQLGVILLKRACAIFLAEGERQLTPHDI